MRGCFSHRVTSATPRRVMSVYTSRSFSTPTNEGSNAGNRHNSDLLVIGGGVAGGLSALRAADEGLDVTLLVKSEDPTYTATEWAQGGIVTQGEDDPPELLVDDILAAGDNVNYKRAVQMLAEDGPDLVTKLLVERLGVPFKRTESDGGSQLAFTEEAAHSRRRIIYVGDATGAAIQKCLTRELTAHPRIKIVTEHIAVDLITRSRHDPCSTSLYESDRVLGAYVLNAQSGEVEPFFAATTLLATGGVGQVFKHTSNPDGATGDGIAMAFRVGAQIRNMEYMQFHPTAFFSPTGERFLISEAVRGEGAWLVDSKRRRFIQHFLPEHCELAPRDEVARAIHEQLSLSGESCVYLDLAQHHKEGLDIKERFPMIYSYLNERNIDMDQDLIPVVPAAHYSCGGVLVDLQGRTSVTGLYAAGEVSCTGLHGANRLASTSLLEGLVWGWKSGKAMADEVASLRDSEIDLPTCFATVPSWQSSGVQEEADAVLFRQDWSSIRDIMWNYAGIVRTPKRLKRAVDDLNYLENRIQKFYRTTQINKSLIELRNGIITAKIIAGAALRNNESNGCHYIKPHSGSSEHLKRFESQLLRTTHM